MGSSFRLVGLYLRSVGFYLRSVGAFGSVGGFCLKSVVLSLFNLSISQFNGGDFNGDRWQRTPMVGLWVKIFVDLSGGFHLVQIWFSDKGLRFGQGSLLSERV